MLAWLGLRVAVLLAERELYNCSIARSASGCECGPRLMTALLLTEREVGGCTIELFAWR